MYVSSTAATRRILAFAVGIILLGFGMPSLYAKDPQGGCIACPQPHTTCATQRVVCPQPTCAPAPKVSCQTNTCVAQPKVTCQTNACAAPAPTCQTNVCVAVPQPPTCQTSCIACPVVDPKDIRKAQKEADHYQHELAEANARALKKQEKHMARLQKAQEHYQHEMAETCERQQKKYAKYGPKLNDAQATLASLQSQPTCVTCTTVAVPTPPKIQCTPVLAKPSCGVCQ
ncbi:MAG TPA: hypothetical protein VFY29_17090 [Terriglobia bacterium]|nr:hypothetical protein [Terriglobia bacterium]